MAVAQNQGMLNRYHYVISVTLLRNSNTYVTSVAGNRELHRFRRLFVLPD
jgi:hypothetical protein